MTRDLTLRLATFQLRCLAREQIADLKVRLARATNLIDETTLRTSIDRVSAALVEVERAAP